MTVTGSYLLRSVRVSLIRSLIRLSGKNLSTERGAVYRINDQGPHWVIQVKSRSGCYIEYKKIFNITIKNVTGILSGGDIIWRILCICHIMPLNKILKSTGQSPIEKVSTEPFVIKVCKVLLLRRQNVTLSKRIGNKSRRYAHTWLYILTNCTFVTIIFQFTYIAMNGGKWRKLFCIVIIIQQLSIVIITMRRTTSYIN